jgi:prepilin-type N-terminal cleavage/methylation domain-containing protein
MNRIASLLRKNDGMSMIEMTVAISLGAVILTAGAGTLASAMGGVNKSRQNQQSAALLSEIIEEARGVNYASVAVKRDVSALEADGRLVGSGGVYSVDPDGTGPLANETLVISDTGSIPLTRILERNKTKYTVSTYVTTPVGADAAFRRVTTVVTWTKGGQNSERRSASFVTNTRRGLPLPNFTIGDKLSLDVNAGAQLRFPVSVTNNGARDAWNMGASMSPARSWTTVFYTDNVPTGSFGSEDLPLSDTDGDGVGDTGLLETDAVKKMWAVADIPSGDPSGTLTMYLAATSASDPDISKNVANTVTVLQQACTACTLTTYYMKNKAGAEPANSDAISPMLLETSVPGAYALPNYDTNRDSEPGRTLKPGGKSPYEETDTTKFALWQAQMASQIKVNGTVNVNLVMKVKSVDPTKEIKIRVYLAHKKNTTTTVIAAGDWAANLPIGTTGYFQVPVSIPVATTATFKNNEYVQIWVTAPESNDDLYLAYGTYEFRANVVLPII